MSLNLTHNSRLDYVSVRMVILLAAVLALFVLTATQAEFNVRIMEGQTQRARNARHPISLAPQYGWNQECCDNKDQVILEAGIVTIPLGFPPNTVHAGLVVKTKHYVVFYELEKKDPGQDLFTKPQYISCHCMPYTSKTHI